jgi:hypothetical protein
MYIIVHIKCQYDIIVIHINVIFTVYILFENRYNVWSCSLSHAIKQSHYKLKCINVSDI